MYNSTCSFSGSAAVVKSSERKPLPLKSGSCLEILKPSKPAVEDKTVKEDSQSTPQVPSSESVCIYVWIICL